MTPWQAPWHLMGSGRKLHLKVGHPILGDGLLRIGADRRLTLTLIAEPHHQAHLADAFLNDEPVPVGDVWVMDRAIGPLPALFSVLGDTVKDRLKHLMLLDDQSWNDWDEDPLDM